MEACGGAHVRGREAGKPGHEMRLIPSAHVKPFVTHQKGGMADAEAICEAARPTMRFVSVKSAETQGAAMVFSARTFIVRQVWTAASYRRAVALACRSPSRPAPCQDQSGT